MKGLHSVTRRAETVPSVSYLSYQRTVIHLSFIFSFLEELFYFLNFIELARRKDENEGGKRQRYIAILDITFHSCAIVIGKTGPIRGRIRRYREDIICIKPITGAVFVGLYLSTSISYH